MSIEGEFQTEEAVPDVTCQRCGQAGGVVVKPWESSCSGYEDYRYECKKCGGNWWIDGIDS